MKIYRANLKNSAHIRATLDLLEQYALDPMGIGRKLPLSVKKRLPQGLRKHKAIVFLASEGKSHAGVAICFMRYSTFSAAPILNIHDFAVSPQHRKQGVGVALLEAVEKFAIKKQCRRITLEVRKDNHPARSLYQKQGIAPGNPPYEYWVKELPT